MGTLLWTLVIVLVLTSSASGFFCSFGLDKMLLDTCKITMVEPGNCTLINGVLLPSLCICAPGFFGTKCRTTVITIPDIFCGNGGTNDKASCICYDIFINTCKMIVVGPGTTISPSLTPSSTSTPTIIFTNVSSTGITTNITTTDITSDLSSATTSTDSPTASTTSVSPEPPTGSTTSVSPEPPTGSTTSVSPEPPSASTTSVSPEQPTGSTTSVSPEPPSASTTSVSPEPPSASTTSVSPEPPTASTTSLSPEPPSASTTSALPEPPSASTTSVSPEPPTSTKTSASSEPPTSTKTSVSPEPSTSPFTGSIPTVDSPTTDPDNEEPGVCPEQFYGKDCQFIYSEIKIDVIIIKLVISIHVQKEGFNSSLNDPSSSYYQHLKGWFLGKMTNEYKKLLPRFKEIKLVSFREGSVIADHEVLLEVDYRNCRKEAAQAQDQLRENLKKLNCTSGPEELCFYANDTIKIEDINDSDLCSKEESIPQVIKPYFSGVNMSKYLLCVTECSVKHKSPINCKWGQCSVNDEGPRCYCDTSDQYWYTGDRCETPVSKPGVIGGVVVGLIVLVAIILLLVICLCCRRRRCGSKDLPVDTNPRWHQHGWERDVREQGRLRNPETDNKMFGPRGPFHTTLETVNPEARVSLPRPQMTS